MLADKFKAPTKNDYLLVLYAALGGLIGGVGLSILESAFSPANLLMGSVAGVVGVVIFNIDRSDWPRLMVAAVLCGISWQSVLDTGKQFIVNKSAEATSENAQELAASLTTAPEAALTTQLSTVVDQANQALIGAGQVKNERVQSRINTHMSQVLSKLNEISYKEPKRVVAAIAALNETAGKQGNFEIWRLSSQSLKKIAADRTLSADVRLSANKAYEAGKIPE